MTRSRRFAVSGCAGALALWAVGGALLPRGLPAGILLLGVVLGSIQALAAVGIVLVYRATGVINFAQAELGAVGAVLAIELGLRWQVPWLPAITAGLLTAALIGALIDAAVMRRFRRAPRLIAAVVTIGLAQVLAGAAQLIANAMAGSGATPFRTPFEVSFEISPVIFDGNYVAAVVAVPLVLVSLGRFLRGSDHGVAMRAAGDNVERAGYLGIPVGRLTTIAWAMAGALSACAILLRTPIVGFSSIGSVSGGGSALLLRTLAAAVIARMDSLPRAVGGAIAIGVLEESASWTWSNTTFVDAILVLVILVALFVQRGRSIVTGLASWPAIREVRPIPGELADVPEVRWAKRLGPYTLLGAAALLPLVLRPSQEFAAGLVLIYAMVAVSLVILTGWSGHISLGQFAIAGFGGTTTALLYQRHGWDLFAALPVGVVVAAVVAVLIGVPALRLPGPFLAVTTLAFAVTSGTFLLEGRHFPWFVQEQLDRPALWGRFPLERDWQMYLLCLAAFATVAVIARNLRRGRFGRATIAVRDNARAAEIATRDPVRVQLFAFAVSGAVAGFAGSFYVLHQEGLQTPAFTPEAGLRLFSMVVIGGLGSVPGAVLGASYIRGVELFLPPEWALVTSGLGVVVLLMFFPEGLGGLLYRGRDHILRRVARRRGIEVPSLVADRRVEQQAPAQLTQLVIRSEGAA